MQENHKSFIKRHVRNLLAHGREPELAIKESFSILDSGSQTKHALNILESSGSLSKTLHETKVIQLESPLLDAIDEKENSDYDYQNDDTFMLVNMLETDQTIDEIFSLLKTKLRLGLVYALWLSAIATLIFTIISRKVIPQFRDIFEGFGAELPAFTKMAIAWQGSLISPGVVGGIFVLSLGMLIFSLKNLSSGLDNRSMVQRLPFIRNIINYTKCIRWLSQLKALSSLGFSLKSCQQRLADQPNSFQQYMPHTMRELLIAEQIEGLSVEFDYQIHQLNQQAEKLITNTTRSLLVVVMFFVVSYVVFTIYASYLPIFQLGAVV